MSAADDKHAYFKAMMSGNCEACLRIERKYGLDGYSPEVVSIGLDAAVRGNDPEEAIDAYLAGEEHAS